MGTYPRHLRLCRNLPLSLFVFAEQQSNQGVAKHMQNRKYFIGVGLLVLLDQITKLLVKGFSIGGFTVPGMRLYESIPVLGDFLRITYVENPGMAFGIEFGEGKIFLTFLSIVIATVVFFYLWRLDSSAPPMLKIALMLILAGAIGNLIDRVFYGVIFGDAPLFYGKVVDFIDVEFPDFTLFGKTFTRWPVFNIADSCVTIGILLLLLNPSAMPSRHTRESVQQMAEPSSSANE